jgi:hypothetical protein
MVSFTRLGQAGAGEINALGLAAVSGGSGQGRTNLAVTAARNGSGQLEVRVWIVGDDGTPAAGDSRTEGAVSIVRAVAVGRHRIVVGMRDAAGKLRLIVYRVSADGRELRRTTTEVSEAVRDLAIAVTGERSFSVALHQPDRRVVIKSWTLDNDDDAFSTPVTLPVGSGKVQQIDLEGGLIEFCLAACTDTGTLRLRAFKAANAMGGAATGGKVRAVAINGGGDGWWTATISKDPATVRTGALGGGRLILDTGVLEVSHWEFEDLSLQSPLVRTAVDGLDGMAKIAWEACVLDAPSPVTYVLARGADTWEKALQKDRGKPKLRLFAFEKQGAQAVRVGQANMAGRFSLGRVVEVRDPQPPTTRSTRLLVAARDGNGKLKLIVWQVSE